MISLTALFKETKQHAGRRNKYVKDMSVLPELRCPEIGSVTHDRDVEIIKHYFDNKSLSEDFLNSAHDSCKKVFKDFCKQNNYNIDWDIIEDGLKDSHAIVFSLKNKFKRPRPKELLKNESPEYNHIVDMDSYSFPSGHTTTAFFIATVLSSVLPEERNNFKTMAELIGQSRIENCVHYPSDVIHGQLLGELIGDIFLNKIDDKKHNITAVKVNRKDEKILSKKLRRKALSIYESMPIKNYCHDMAEFIFNSCQIEQIDINYDKCYKACHDFVSGYPATDIKDNHVRSHIKMMILSNKISDLNTVFSMINLHKQLDDKVIDRGKPGMLRYFNRASKYGNEYCYPNDIIENLQKLKKIKNPYIKHIVYEWIHPFCDGNGRSGRVKLLLDLKFDFNAINNFCGKNYFKNIQSFVDKYENINNVFNL
jgi:hypothetical protein